jgi:hypothetical protein
MGLHESASSGFHKWSLDKNMGLNAFQGFDQWIQAAAAQASPLHHYACRKMKYGWPCQPGSKPG